MPRRALTSRFPRLAPAVIETRIALRALGTRGPEYRLARAPAALFPFRIHRHHIVLRRRLVTPNPRFRS